jgi:hypothetical protein
MPYYIVETKIHTISEFFSISVSMGDIDIGGNGGTVVDGEGGGS